MPMKQSSSFCFILVLIIAIIVNQLVSAQFGSMSNGGSNSKINSNSNSNSMMNSNSNSNSNSNINSNSGSQSQQESSQANSNSGSNSNSEVPTTATEGSGSNSNSDVPSTTAGGGSGSGSGSASSIESTTVTQTPATPAVRVLNDRLVISYIYRSNRIYWSLNGVQTPGQYMAVAVSSGGMAGKGVACKQPELSDPTNAANCTCFTNSDSFTSAKRTDDTPIVYSTRFFSSMNRVTVNVGVDPTLMDVSPGPKRVIFAIGTWDDVTQMVTAHASTDRGFQIFDFLMETTLTSTTTTSTTTTTTQTSTTSSTTTVTGGGDTPSTSTSTTTTLATEPTTTTDEQGNTPTPPPTTTSTATIIDNNMTSTSTSESPPDNQAAAPLAPLDDTLSEEAEARTRGVLTFIAALMSPIIGPSAIFDTQRALSVFTYARCSHQNYPYVKQVSTSHVPWPEAIIPMASGGDENGYFRGTLVSNLILVPLIFFILTVGYGFYQDRKKPGKLPPLPGPKPTSKFGVFWLKMCDWMYYGSTLTFLVIIFALGFDGAVSSIFSIFFTTVKTADVAGDVILSLLYLIVLIIFLGRVARTIYLSTPTRFFCTPGMIKKKANKKPKQELPDWVADFLGGFWGRFFVVGDWVWRPGSVRSFRQLRECQALFRRFHGPRDEDRAKMADEYAKLKAAAMAAAGLTPSVMMKPEDQQQQEHQEQEQKPPSDEPEVNNDNNEETSKKQDEGNNKEEGDAQKKEEGEEGEKKEEDGENNNNSTEQEIDDQKKKKQQQMMMQKQKQQQQKNNNNKPPPTEPPFDAKMFFRRAVLTDFFFFEFIFVLFISAFKGMARVSEDPDGCYGMAMGSAIFNLFFLIFIIAVRPFNVPIRNILAILSSILAVVANFMVASSASAESGAVPATGLAVFAAILPIFYFLITGVPRLLIRFVWALQHAPGKQIPLRDPTKPPPPPEVLEEEKKKLELQEKQAQVPLRDLMKQKQLQDGNELGSPLLNGAGGDEIPPHLREGTPEWQAEQERIMAEQGIGTLSRLQKVFFPPPPQPNRKETSSYGDIDDDLADSFGDDDDDSELLDLEGYDVDGDDEDDDLYLSKMLRPGPDGQARLSPQHQHHHSSRYRDMELQDVQFRVQTLQKQLEEAENGISSSPTNNQNNNNNKFQFAGQTVMSPTALSRNGNNNNNNAMTPNIYSPASSQGFIPNSPGASTGRFSNNNTNVSTPRLGGGGGSGAPIQQKGRNIRVDQEVALASLLYQICQTKKKADNM